MNVSHLSIPLMQMARSLVICPSSIVSIQTASKLVANWARASLLSNLARWERPRVHAKIEAKKREVKRGKGRGERHTDGIGGSLLSLLVLSVMTSDSSMGSLCLDSLSIGTDKDGSHETERAIACNRWDRSLSPLPSLTLCNGVRLDISIVILACPYESSIRLHCLSDHIIDETMLIPDTRGLELSLVLLKEEIEERKRIGIDYLVDLLEDIFETTIVLLKNRVLSAEINKLFIGRDWLVRILLNMMHTSCRGDRLSEGHIGRKHGRNLWWTHQYCTWREILRVPLMNMVNPSLLFSSDYLELKYFMDDFSSISSLGNESNLQFSCSRNDEISCFVLKTIDLEWQIFTMITD